LPDAPPRHDGPARNGQPTAAILYRGEEQVSLSGPFRSLADVRLDRDVTTARFVPRLGEWAARFAAFRLPVLLIDAMLQIGLFIQNAGNGGSSTVSIPVGVDTVEIFTAHNDVVLLDTHGDNVLLRAGADGVQALAPDGTVLVRVRGIRHDTNTEPVATAAG